MAVTYTAIRLDSGMYMDHIFFSSLETAQTVGVYEERGRKVVPNQLNYLRGIRLLK